MMLSGETKNRSFKIFNLSPQSINKFVVRSVDKDGNESENSNRAYTRASISYNLEVGGAFAIPLATESKMFYPGGG